MKLCRSGYADDINERRRGISPDVANMTFLTHCFGYGEVEEHLSLDNIVDPKWDADGCTSGI